MELLSRSESPTNSDALVICTYKRPDDLERCLRSLRNAGPLPEIIMVVDGDKDENLQRYLKSEFPHVTYIPSEKGLTIQRNLALDLLRDKRLVYFVDDDVEFLHDYFQEVSKKFEIENVVGVGVTPLPKVETKNKLITRLLGINSPHPGTVRRHGLNVGRYSGEGFADWLPGCSMTYLVSAIGDNRFDERRRGYALGEDVDFGLKMCRHGKLFWFSDELIIHHQSPVNRQKRALTVRQSAHQRWTLANDKLGRVSKFHVMLGLVGEFIFWFLMIFRWRSLEPANYAKSVILGAWDIISKGRLDED